MYSAPQPTAPSVPSEPAAAESSSSPSLDSLALGPGDMLVSSSMSRSVGPRGQASIGAFNREYRLVDVDTWRCTHCNLTARDTPIIRKGPLGAHVRAQCFLPPLPSNFFFLSVPKQTLCNACGLYFSTKNVLPANRLNLNGIPPSPSPSPLLASAEGGDVEVDASVEIDESGSGGGGAVTAST